MQTATPTPQKARLSVVLDINKKQALEQLAKRQNRTLNYLMGELVDKALQEAQAQAEYEAYVEKRVMTAYQSVLDGKQGIALDDAFNAIREHGRAYAHKKGKL